MKNDGTKFGQQDYFNGKLVDILVKINEIIYLFF